MRIKSVEVRIIKVPYGPDGFSPSWLPGVVQETYGQTLVRFFSDEGSVGFASTNCFGEEVYEFTREISPMFLGRRLETEDHLENIWSNVKERANARSTSNMLRTTLREAIKNNSDRNVDWLSILKNFVSDPFRSSLMRHRNIPLDHRHSYLNVALWDLLARSRKVPVAECLGKERDGIEAYASTGELVDQRMFDFIDRCEEDGFGSAKLRIKQKDPGGSENELIDEIMDSSSHDFEIGIDANQGWSLLPPYWGYEDALQIGRYYEERGASWLEEPLGNLDIESLQQLTEALTLETVGGELEAGMKRQRNLLSVYDTINPDVCMAIGISDGRALAELASDHGTGFTPHTWGLGPSLAAGLQLVCSIPNCSRLEYPLDPSWPINYRDMILEDPLEVDDGRLRLPDEPGLGVKLDLDAVEDFTVAVDRIGPR